MNLVFGSPGRYVQGTEVLAQAGTYLAHCGRTAVVVIDSYVLGLIRERLDATCAQANVALHYLTFDGEITADGIAGLRAAAASVEFDLILAVGGGKCIDAGKALAHSSGRALVTMPTVASNDAPTSKNYVVYDAHHQLSEVGHLLVSPRYVLVDTGLIAQAPRAFLLAGIADALTKKFEAEQCFNSGGVNMFGARPALSGLVLAQECYRVIRQYAEPALAQAGSGEVTVAFDHLIEAVLLMSGLGFESGGLSIAHAMTRGLSKIPRRTAAGAWLASRLWLAGATGTGRPRRRAAGRHVGLLPTHRPAAQPGRTGRDKHRPHGVDAGRRAHLESPPRP